MFRPLTIGRNFVFGRVFVFSFLLLFFKQNQVPQMIIGMGQITYTFFSFFLFSTQLLSIMSISLTFIELVNSLMIQRTKNYTNLKKDFFVK